MSYKRKVRYPFFIIGCSRSGTSLLRAILNHHPDVAIPLESIFLLDYLKVNGKVGIEKQRKMFKKEPMLKEWGIDLEDKDVGKIRTTRELIELPHRLYAEKMNKKYWGNKTPRLTRYCEQIKKIFPEAVFIHMIRDPRAVALSLSKSPIHKSNVYFGAKRWTRYLEAVLTFERKYKSDLLRVYFENLIRKPESQMKEICKFLGLSYKKSMFDYQKLGNKEYRKYHRDAHKNLKEPLQKDRIDYWKNGLTRKEIRVVEHISKELMRELNYELIDSRTYLDQQEIYFYRLHRVFSFGLQIIRYLVYWPGYLFYTIWRKFKFNTFFEEIRDINY